MFKLKSILVAALMCGTITFASAEESCEKNTQRGIERKGEEGKKGDKRHRMMKRGKQWFANLPGTKEEMQKNRENMKKIMKSIHEKGKEVRTKYKKEGNSREETRELIAKAMQEAVAEVAEQMVNEKIRHSRAIADILEKNKAIAIEKIKETMKNKYQMRKRKNHKRRKGNSNEKQQKREQEEGAVF